MTDDTDDDEWNRQPNTAGLAQGAGGDADDVAPPEPDAEADSDAVGDDGLGDGVDEGFDGGTDDLPQVPADGWKAVDCPVDDTLLSVGFTAAGPVATGASGKVLHRNPEDGEWRVIVEAGASVERNNIHDMDTTDDGERFWFVGDSGIIGAFDVADGRKYDFSAPMEKTSTWEAVAVTGDRGDERVLFANGSGELLPAEMDDHGYPEWGEVHKPGRGSTMPAVEFDKDADAPAPEAVAYAIDTTGKAYQLDPDAEHWAEIGVRNAQVNFHDVSVADGHLLVAGDDGIVYRYDRLAENWTPVQAGAGTVYEIDQRDGERVAVTADGEVYQPEQMVGWQPRPTETREDLHGVALGREFAPEGFAGDVAVGASGTVLERDPDAVDDEN